MDNEKVFLTADEAIAMLPDCEYVHTIRGRGFMVGCSWKRKDIIDTLKKAPEKSIKLSGPIATGMGHGICAIVSGSPLFIETKEDQGQGEQK